uniref:Aldehyde:ferredoxin oxidoreductase n=1 Tax=Mesoaciditoga lauensis TaxID=1495039 RepID=A0A7V3VTL0_9BACT
MNGYTGKILHIDLSNMNFEISLLDKELAMKYIGGRGFNMYNLFHETPRYIDPLSDENNLYIGVGPLDGTSFPGASRVNFSGKSPQTGILGDSNAGGAFGPELKYAGFDQVIISGKAPKNIYIFIHDEKVEFKDASSLKDMDVLQTQKTIKYEIGDSRVQVGTVGPAAEHGVTFAGIFCTGVRAAARTGMGTLLASKNVKAIAVRGKGAVSIANPDNFRKLMDDLIEKIKKHEEYPSRRQMGTTRLVSSLSRYGALSTRHFQKGSFEDVDMVSGETLASTKKIKSRGCYSCTLPCSRIYRTDDGVTGEGPEFEGLAGFTSRVGNNDLDFALHAMNLCNRLGLDVITTTEAISFLMELNQLGMIGKENDGLDLSWGNKETIIKLIEKISNVEGIGAIFSHGVRNAAKILGVGEELVMDVKGLDIFQADPRGLKAYALGLAIASRGGDHLRTEPSFEFSENAVEAVKRYGTPKAAFRLEYEGKGKVVKDYEERSALADSLNACKNTIVNMEIVNWEDTAKILKAATDLDFEGEEVRKSCERIVNLERIYLVSLGLTRKDDRLPKRFLEEPMPGASGETSGHVVELDKMLDEYYAARGWDILTGIPTVKKLKELGLDREMEDIKNSVKG